MKKILFAFAVLAVMFSGCTKGFEERIEALEERVDALEAFVTNLNAEVGGIRSIVANLEKNVYVTDIEVLKNASGAEIGYKLTFNQGHPIEIRHGNTGAQGLTGPNGKTPGIDMDTDGNWYWRYVGGDWILDGEGNKIPVQKSLHFEISNGHLFVSIDGSPAIDLGPVQGSEGQPGDSWFDGVEVDEEAGTVTISIAGSEHDLVLPFNAAAADGFSLELHLPDPAAAIMGGKLHIGYTLTGCAAESAAIFVQAPEDWAVELDESAKRISLTVGKTAGRVVVYAINNETGDVKARFVNYNPEELFVVDVANKNYYFSPKGGAVEVTVSTGIVYEYQSSNSWFNIPDPVTKAEVKHNKFTITAPENTTGSTKKGDLTLLAKDGGRELFSMSFEQRSYIPALITDKDGNTVKWEETFTLKIGENTNLKKNPVTIELSDDFSKGAYKIKNMFISDLWVYNNQNMSNVGADYYADEENGVMTVYQANLSYYFNSNIELAVDLDAMTLVSSAASIGCSTPAPSNKSAEILDYKIALPKADEGDGADVTIDGTWIASYSYAAPSFSAGGGWGDPVSQSSEIVFEKVEGSDDQFIVTKLFGSELKKGSTADYRFDATLSGDKLALTPRNNDSQYPAMTFTFANGKLTMSSLEVPYTGKYSDIVAVKFN